MEFRNLTPFDALCYGGLDPAGAEHRIIAMKVGYRLVPDDNEAGVFHARVMDGEPLPLCMEDRYYGEPGYSSAFEESDLAPYKPKCDVLLRGQAHAPGGKPSRSWRVRFKLSLPVAPANIQTPPPRPLNPRMPLSEKQRDQWQLELQQAERTRLQAPTTRVLMDKVLQVTGERHFKRRWGRWWLSRPARARTVPLRWEYAFGGRSEVANPGHAGDPSAPSHWLNEVCFSNPLGCGWIERRHRRLANKAGQSLTRLPAPRIEDPQQPCSELVQGRHPDGEQDARAMARLAAGYGAAPAGFGIVGRAWAPRLAHAGTYDDDWLKRRWPGLPEDFDFAYWNGAPADQQIEYPLPGTRIELWHLTDPSQTPRGYLRTELPQHKPFVFLRMSNGAMVPMPLLTDTLIVDTETMELHVTHRISIPQGTPVRVIEARFETDPEAPLVKVDQAGIEVEETTDGG